jgi:hypothetical protein
VPELLFELGYGPSGTTLGKAVGDLTLIAFYYLLRVGEYTVKGTRNESKRTVQFKLEDVTFFHRNERGQLRCLPQDAPLEMLLSAEGACLKLDNQKNGWKGVCVYHQHNGDPLRCPIRALARRVTHMRRNNAGPRDYLSSYYVNGARTDVTAEDISKHLKLAAGLLNYPTCKGIPVERVDTHSLRGGGANALALVWLFGNGNPKNGTMERGHVQRIHSGRAGKLCQWYVHGDENKVQFHELCWQCIPRHHGNSIDNGVQHRVQYRWSGITHSNEQIFSGHEAALG